MVHPMFFGRMEKEVTFNAGENYKFNTILTHVGGGYSTDSGIYTCPETGWYLISVSLTGIGEAYVKIFKINIVVRHLTENFICNALQCNYKSRQDFEIFYYAIKYPFLHFTHIL